MPRSARSVHSWLLLLVVACTLPGALVGSVYLAHEYQRGREFLIRDSVATARALTAVVDRELAATRAALTALAASPYLTSHDLARFDQQAREVQRDQNLNNIVLIDAATHRQVVNTLEPFGSPLPAEPNEGLLRVFDTAKPVVTDLFMGPVAQRPLLAIGVPVRRDDAVRYVLAAGVWPQRLSLLLEQQRLPPQWIGVIFDSTGTVVARTHEMERFIGRKARPELVERMHLVAEESIETTTLDGIPALMVFSRSAVSSWSVAIGIPSRELSARRSGSLYWLFAATLLVFGSALGMAWFVGRRMQQALSALVGPALALGRGEPAAAPTLDVEEANAVASALNRTSRLLQQAMQQAMHDPLTGLANRTLFEETLHSQIAVCRRAGTSLALLYLDLDDFKAINDQNGHASGDRLLQAVATRIKQVVRDADVAARLGGDEFAVVLPDTNAKGALLVGGKLLDALSGEQPRDDAALRVRVRVSVGAAVFPDHADSAEELLHRADQAMYDAKAAASPKLVMAARSQGDVR